MIVVHLSEEYFDSMHEKGFIADYTDDGYVLHNKYGWITAEYMIERLLSIEEKESVEKETS